jgi:hypothetical protein
LRDKSALRLKARFVPTGEYRSTALSFHVAVAEGENWPKSEFACASECKFDKILKVENSVSLHVRTTVPVVLCKKRDSE